MQEIIYAQRDAAKPLSGKTFLLQIASIILRLAVAQLVINLAIQLSGVGLLNVLFYLYAVLLLVRFMRSTVAIYVYTLGAQMLRLERKLGDSPITLVEIPQETIVSVRPVYRGENLGVCYRQVTHIDPAVKPTFRTRLAFAMSLLCSSGARWLMGTKAEEQLGYVVVFDENGVRQACTFRPNETMRDALQDTLGDRFDLDERMLIKPVDTVYARTLQRSFPSLYAYVDPLLRPEDVQEAEAELAREKKHAKSVAPETKKADRAKKAKKPTKTPRKKEKKQEKNDEVHDNSL